MPIVPTIQNQYVEESLLAVPLARYAQLINYDECAFWGVNSGTVTGNQCRDIWTNDERIYLAKYLLEAQKEVEDEIGYPLVKKWFSETKRVYRIPLTTRRGKLVDIGIKATSTIASGQAVNDKTVDPYIIGPVATTVTDESEIRVYHPGTDYEVSPSDITISGGNVTISIPRCRLVKVALMDNTDTGLAYDTTANFEDTVDIKRVYNDPSTAGTLIARHSCNQSCADNACADETHDACVYIRDGDNGIIDIYPAQYSSGSWQSQLAAICQRNYTAANIYYYAGVTADRQIEDIIIRLAHSKMPEAPCGCDVLKRMWSRDRNIPDALTRERINCPYGLSDGAWIAWKFTQAPDNKKWKMSVV